MPAYDQIPDTADTKVPAQGHRLMLLGLIAGMALAALSFALLIRTSLHPMVLVVTSSLLVPALGGFVAGLIGRSLASALGVVLLAVFGISNLASSPLYVIFLALLSCCAITVGSAALGILTARRDPWALIFPVVFLAVIGWQSGVVRADHERYAQFQRKGIAAVLAQVRRDLLDMPSRGLRWHTWSDNDLRAASFVAESAQQGRRYRLWVRRDDLRLRRFEVNISPEGRRELSILANGPDRLRAARAYLLVLGFHPLVADKLIAMEHGFCLQTRVGKYDCWGQVDPSGAVSVTWGALGHR